MTNIKDLAIVQLFNKFTDKYIKTEVWKIRKANDWISHSDK